MRLKNDPTENGNGTVPHRRWCAVQVQARREKLALQHLQRQHFKTFCPYLEKVKSKGGRTSLVREPLFPGYLFVSLDLEWDTWRSINGTIGVSKLVMLGDRPAHLPVGFVETLQANIDENGTVTFEEALNPGDHVRVLGGAFDSITGTLVSADRQSRVMILVDLLSGPRKVSIPRSQLISYAPS